MCVNPRMMTINGLQQAVACRKCWQCIANRTSDWVGRCIAEHEDSVATTVVTMTYGSTDRVGEVSDDLGAKVLMYSDVQKWLKLIRKQYSVRYFLAGELGALKGRAHWHAILFWKQQFDSDGEPRKSVPNFPQGVKVWDDEFWPHGHTLWDGDFDPASIAYVAKYVNKTDAVQSEIHMSRFPPLGHDYFMKRAKLFAQQGILPKDAFYSFPEYRRKDGSVPRYLLQGVSLDNFLSEFFRCWVDHWGSHPLDHQHSEFLQTWLDQVAPRVRSEQFERRQVRRAPDIPTPGEYSEPVFDERTNSWYAYAGGLPRLIWSFDQEGERAWSVSFVSEAEAALRRRLLSRSRDKEAYRAGRVE